MTSALLKEHFLWNHQRWAISASLIIITVFNQINLVAWVNYIIVKRIYQGYIFAKIFSFVLKGNPTSCFAEMYYSLLKCILLC